ncbi:MAG: PorT family protein [Bryobacterales bacterium]|nr:PorT family protein [Bryobacterales bacterium]
MRIKQTVLSIALAAFTLPTFAQSISFGVKGGVPLTEAFSTDQRYPEITQSSVTRRYAVGPTAEIGLPILGLGVEATALYRRIGWDTKRSDPSDPYLITVRSGAWDFSALLKHRFERAGWRPYLGGGAALRRMFTTRTEAEFLGQPNRHISKQMVDELKRKNIAGLVASAGVELGSGPVRISPELRYTRWLMNNIYPAFPLSTQANQVDLLVSITFGSR